MKNPTDIASDAADRSDARAAMEALAGQAERLFQLRQSLGLSKQAMAERIGCSPRAYGNYEAGERALDLPQIGALAALGVDAAWLVTGIGGPQGQMQARTAQSPLIDNEFALIPRYNVTVSAGNGTWPDDEQVVDRLAFRRDWLRANLGTSPEQLACISATGDSMAPTIAPGDMLLIDTSVREIRDDAIYVIALRAMLQVKRVQVLMRGAVVSSDNTAYAPITLGPKDLEDLRIVGRVRWIGRVV